MNAATRGAGFLRGAVAALLLAAALPACWVTETSNGDLDQGPGSEYAQPERIRENIRKLGEELPPPVSDSIIWELCQAGKDALPFLIEALQDESPTRRSRVLITLGNFRDPDIVKHIAPFLTDSDPQIHLVAAAAMVRQGYRDGIPVLIRGLRNEDLRRREWCGLCLFDATGLHFGFHANDPLDRREFSIRKWEEWWKAEGVTFSMSPRGQ